MTTLADTFIVTKVQPSLLNTHSDEAQLFVDLWPLIDNVKLDRSQRRERLLKQGQWLKETGYTFNKRLQEWQK